MRQLKLKEEQDGMMETIPRQYLKSDADVTVTEANLKQGLALVRDSLWED